MVQSTSLPLVSANLTVAAGAAVDPPGKAGLADMTASLLTKGAGKRSATQVAQDIEGLGAEINAGASWDGSTVSVSVASGKTAPALAILADAVRRPAFAPDELERLRRRTLDSLKVSLQQPGNLARYVAAESVFAGGPYGHVADGAPGSIAAMRQEDIAALHRAGTGPTTPCWC